MDLSIAKEIAIEFNTSFLLTIGFLFLTIEFTKSSRIIFFFRVRIIFTKIYKTLSIIS